MDHELMTMWLSVDPMADKYPSISPYAYCVWNPVKLVDPDGEFPIETIWDIANVVYDVGAAVVNHVQGKHSETSSNWSDAALDVAAVFIPYIPAGATKVAKAGRTVEKAADASRVSTAPKATSRAKKP